MKTLKILAIITFSLLLIMVALVGYFYLTSEVLVVNISAQGTPVSNDPRGFEQLKRSIAEDTFIGTLYQVPMEWKDEYIYLDYTLTIRNNCLIPIDMIEVQVVPQSSDILQMADLTVHSLDTKSEGQISARILASKDSHSIREMIVTYYVWGVSFHLRTTFAN